MIVFITINCTNTKSRVPAANNNNNTLPRCMCAVAPLQKAGLLWYNICLLNPPPRLRRCARRPSFRLLNETQAIKREKRKNKQMFTPRGFSRTSGCVYLDLISGRVRLLPNNPVEHWVNPAGKCWFMVILLLAEKRVGLGLCNLVIKKILAKN